ncbi:MAG: right-handed parallel beta-helix repeat-containing protein [Planctomycetota bacterium]|jgi:predicted outer membrane repeat protein
MKPFMMVLALCPILSVIAFSTTIHVPADYPTIQEAIEAAVDGDTVLVAPGTYVENIDFIGKAISVMSSAGPDQTVIDGGNPQYPGLGAVVMFNNGETKDALLEGFTIYNGTGYTIPPGELAGGGIYCRNAWPTLSKNVVTENSADIGGGIYIKGEPLKHLVTQCVISKNQAEQGGGIYCNGTVPIIQYCKIEENSEGGGINLQVMPHDEGFVRSNIIKGNFNSNNGGGICSSGDVNFYNNVITDNQGAWGGGIFSLGGCLTNNIVTHNTALADDGQGGGMYIRWTNAIVDGNYIAFNQAGEEGGGLRMRGGWLTSNVICYNIAGTQTGSKAMGGGASLESNANFHEVSNCLIFKNHSYGRGGGIYTGPGFDIEITNFTLVGNTADSGTGICAGGWATVILTNSILWDSPKGEIQANEQPVITYCDIWGGWPGEGNIEEYPLFVDPAGDDFHLLFKSPCKDAGTNSGAKNPEDHEGDPRIAYGTVDMGADEFYTHLYYKGQASPGRPVQFKLVDLPGSTPVGLYLGFGILDPPMPTAWGYFYIQPPWFMWPMTSIPANGVQVKSAKIPLTPPAPYDIFMQALIGTEPDSLTNLEILEVR